MEKYPYRIQHINDNNNKAAATAMPVPAHEEEVEFLMLSFSIQCDNFWYSLGNWDEHTNRINFEWKFIESQMKIEAILGFESTKIQRN